MLHHVTAIASDLDANVRFYSHTLGLRLVKVTVNFDDPGSYHLYYGNDLGAPGTLVTFFVWPSAEAGKAGPPQVTSIGLAVPGGALDYWRRRLDDAGVTHESVGGERLAVRDPDGLMVELIERPGCEVWPYVSAGPVVAEHAIRALDAPTLRVRDAAGTVAFFERMLGMSVQGRREDGARYHLVAGDAGDAPARWLDVVSAADAPAGAFGPGTVHHVAFRAADDAAQQATRERLREARVAVSEVRERVYFRSIYFREVGGVICEVATDGPGMTADESPAALGSTLRLPPWLESERSEIERILPPLPRPTA